MSRNRGKDTKPEVALRKALWAQGFRYRIASSLRGKPDVVFHAHRVAVFVDGCYWHRCPEHGTEPKTNAAFWKAKLDGNVERDKRVTAELRSAGWTVLRIWEHEVKRDMSGAVSRIAAALKADQPSATDSP